MSSFLSICSLSVERRVSICTSVQRIGVPRKKKKALKRQSLLWSEGICRVGVKCELLCREKIGIPRRASWEQLWIWVNSATSAAVIGWRRQSKARSLRSGGHGWFPQCLFPHSPPASYSQSSLVMASLEQDATRAVRADGNPDLQLGTGLPHTYGSEVSEGVLTRGPAWTGQWQVEAWGETGVEFSHWIFPKAKMP